MPIFNWTEQKELWMQHICWLFYRICVVFISVSIKSHWKGKIFYLCGFSVTEIVIVKNWFFHNISLVFKFSVFFFSFFDNKHIKMTDVLFIYLNDFKIEWKNRSRKLKMNWISKTKWKFRKSREKWMFEVTQC